MNYEKYPPWLIRKVAKYGSRQEAKCNLTNIKNPVLENCFKILGCRYHQEKWKRVWNVK